MVQSYSFLLFRKEKKEGRKERRKEKTKCRKTESSRKTKEWRGRKEIREGRRYKKLLD